ncbi:MAG: hypothetical protein J6R18_10285 [Kiritimatiellae bacterium]|nr:hypothetical protein [Kiritimatiellia bacterium]
MVTRQDLDEAIRECEGAPATYAVCQKLAVLYTVRDYLYGNLGSRMSHAEENGRKREDMIGDYGDSEFLRLVCGKAAAEVWDILGELMETLQIINPRLYDGVMRRIDEI